MLKSLCARDKYSSSSLSSGLPIGEILEGGLTENFHVDCWTKNPKHLEPDQTE